MLVLKSKFFPNIFLILWGTINILILQECVFFQSLPSGAIKMVQFLISAFLLVEK